MCGLRQFLYHSLGCMLLPFFLPTVMIHAFCRPGRLGACLAKLGLRLPPAVPTTRQRIWIHAVSAGEVMACQPLIRLLQTRGCEVWLSTGTEAGFRIATMKAENGLTIFYFPFDFAFSVRRSLNRVRPHVILVCEMEIWPAFLWEARRRGIPVYLISGRMPQRDFRRYRRLRCFFGPVLQAFSGLFVQTTEDALRMRALCPAGNVQICGNLKFDYEPECPPGGNESHQMQKGAFTICAASTHREDHAIVISAFHRLHRKHPGIRLVIAPRHPERSDAIVRTLKEQGLLFTRRSSGGTGENTVFLLDTIGELAAIYPMCQVVVMGGSFSKRTGGHNIIEPAALGKCILCGEHMENWSDVYAQFREAGALVVTTKETLGDDLMRLLRNPEKIVETGERARSLVEENRGVSLRIAEKVLAECSSQATPSALARPSE